MQAAERWGMGGEMQEAEHLGPWRAWGVWNCRAWSQGFPIYPCGLLSEGGAGAGAEVSVRICD